jgi:hypothetical protein
MSIRAELTAFITYDHQLRAAAEAAGIDATRPSDANPG